MYIDLFVVRIKQDKTNTFYFQPQYRNWYHSRLPIINKYKMGKNMKSFFLDIEQMQPQDQKNERSPANCIRFVLDATL